MRLNNPVSGKPTNFSNEAASRKLRKIKPNTSDSNFNATASTALAVGNIVEHNRFGRGKVLSLEGKGPNKKAEIQFGTVGKKKLLLQFAKLFILNRWRNTSFNCRCKFKQKNIPQINETTQGSIFN